MTAVLLAVACLLLTLALVWRLWRRNPDRRRSWRREPEPFDDSRPSRLPVRGDDYLWRGELNKRGRA